ncbi:hypothetical protein NPIL_610601 [Nephila pilipes]|uniref:Uncharacterized protein n=1 Tax=Nephila pilipes TaxID=299642 RepID=A0A8X6QNM4_NEPPI|nr:hypothetical protein NPIL_610601 [Nephila pilipes]
MASFSEFEELDLPAPLSPLPPTLVFSPRPILASAETVTESPRPMFPSAESVASPEPCSTELMVASPRPRPSIAKPMDAAVVQRNTDSRRQAIPFQRGEEAFQTETYR